CCCPVTTPCLVSIASSGSVAEHPLELLCPPAQPAANADRLGEGAELAPAGDRPLVDAEDGREVGDGKQRLQIGACNSAHGVNDSLHGEPPSEKRNRLISSGSTRRKWRSNEWRSSEKRRSAVNQTLTYLPFFIV